MVINTGMHLLGAPLKDLFPQKKEKRTGNLLPHCFLPFSLSYLILEHLLQSKCTCCIQRLCSLWHSSQSIYIYIYICKINWIEKGRGSLLRSKQYSPYFEVGLETPFAFRIVQGDCVCVCERETETETETDKKRESCSYRKMER